MVEEKLVEGGAVDLVSVLIVRVEALLKPETVPAGIVAAAKFGAVFAKEPSRLQFVPDPKFLEQVVPVGEEGLANTKARKFFLF